MTRILVTGASGLLGINFCLRFSNQHELVGVVNSHPLSGAPFTTLTAELCAHGEVEKILDQVEPEIVLNCAAMANVDQCEAQPELAWRLNAEFPGELAQACAQRAVRLVHISTDAVFDGVRGDYSEEDETNPLGVYARSKLAGERAVLEALPAALVARVNFYGWSLSGRRSLAEFFYYNLLERRPIQGFTDVFFCPLETTSLADILLRLVESNCDGITHVVSSEHLSKYSFGMTVAERFDLDGSLISPVSVGEGGLRAARSLNLSLRTDKLTAVLGAPPPGQSEGLQRFYELFQTGYPQQVRGLAGNLS